MSYIDLQANTLYIDITGNESNHQLIVQKNDWWENIGEKSLYTWESRFIGEEAHAWESIAERVNPYVKR